MARQRLIRESYSRSADVVARAVQRDRLRPPIGAGFDIKIYSFATGSDTRHRRSAATRARPAPNGRHIAFTSTRNGSSDRHHQPRRQRPAVDHAKATTDIRLVPVIWRVAIL
jgi:hypothetical protein